MFIEKLRLCIFVSVTFTMLIILIIYLSCLFRKENKREDIKQCDDECQSYLSDT